MAYSVGNAACRLGRVVMVCWIAEAAMQFDDLVGNAAMQSGMRGNAAMPNTRGCGNVGFNYACVRLVMDQN